jgi:hypothetical protein
VNLIFQILDLALSLLKALSGGNLQKDAAVAGLLLQIVQKGHLAYQSHTGETLDQAQIRAE